MTGEEMAKARIDIARAWGIRRLTQADLGRALGHGHQRDPGRNVARYESGVLNIPPQVAVLMQVYLAGGLPPDEVRQTLTAFRPAPFHETPSVGGNEPSRSSRRAPG